MQIEKVCGHLDRQSLNQAFTERAYGNRITEHSSGEIMICPGTCDLRSKPYASVVFLGRTFKPEHRAKSYTGYYREKTTSSHLGVYLHRLVSALSAECGFGTWRPARGRHVHHRDWDTYNNNSLNLTPLTEAEHTRVHRTGAPEPMLPGCPGSNVCRSMMEAKAAQDREIFNQRRRDRSEIKFGSSTVSVIVDGEIQAVKRFCRENGVDNPKFFPKTNGQTLVCVSDETSAAKVRLFSYARVPGWR